jgi:predicted O-methyltransferase YrrM
MSTGYAVDEQARRISNMGMARRAYQKGFEFERLLELLLWREPAAVLEIGTAEGGAWYAFAQCAKPDAVMVSIDLADELDEPRQSVPVLEAYCQPGQRAVMIRGDSRLETTRDQAKEACPDGYDFLFIDGDHTLPAVTRDHELYAPLVKPGGLVAFHDIMEPAARRIQYQRATEVDLFWDALEKPPRVWEFIDYSDLSFGGIGVYEVLDS